MKGRESFTADEANELRSILVRLRIAERNEQKKLRARVRTIGFRISDWDNSGAGFTASDFDDLVQRGLVTIKLDAHDVSGVRAPDVTVRPQLAGPVRADLLEAAIAALTAPRHPLADAHGAVKGVAGIYAIYGGAQTWLELGLGEPPDDRPLYVGKAEESLMDRDINTHFGHGQTGRSTVRRSIAALLRSKLGLRGIPRNPAKPERPANYGLNEGHEAALGEWMHAHLLLATWPKPTGYPSLIGVERRVISTWQPPLNLQDNVSPWKRQLTDARRMMADDARKWARDRGFRL